MQFFLKREGKAKTMNRKRVLEKTLNNEYL